MKFACGTTDFFGNTDAFAAACFRLAPNTDDGDDLPLCGSDFEMTRPSHDIVLVQMRSPDHVYVHKGVAPVWAAELQRRSVATVVAAYYFNTRDTDTLDVGAVLSLPVPVDAPVISLETWDGSVTPCRLTIPATWASFEVICSDPPALSLVLFSTSHAQMAAMVWPAGMPYVLSLVQGIDVRVEPVLLAGPT